MTNYNLNVNQQCIFTGIYSENIPLHCGRSLGSGDPSIEEEDYK